MASGLPFRSRRSPVMSTDGLVCTSQPAASAVGAAILAQGGTAMDAAVAAAAVLNLTEPGSTGLGGDGFLLYYEAQTKKVHGLNGSGRSPRELTIDLLREKGVTGDIIPDIHCVTVPGLAALWVDSVARFGRLPLSQVLQPAIRLCRGGVPIEPVAAHFWDAGAEKMRQWSGTSELLVGGTRAPAAGELWTNPGLGRVFQALADSGKRGFYEGPVAEAIVEAVARHGGVLSLADLREHETQVVEPLTCEYHGHQVHEIPPNSQGIVALLALGILSHFDLAALPHNSPEYLHLVIEALRLAFADANQYVCDAELGDSEVTQEVQRLLLSPEYLKSRAALISRDRANAEVQHGVPHPHSDTVYLSVVDRWGNAASFINSIFTSFGTGLVPAGCGFALHSRGRCFSLDPGHPNALRPGKRPYHTLMPGMITKDGELVYCFGVMGDYMQPQGQVQVALGLIDHGLDPQAALDALRVRVVPQPVGSEVQLEEGLPEEVAHALQAKGHHVIWPVGGFRDMFGRGQVIHRCPGTGGCTAVLVGGSDPRADGCAIPVII